jgi:hypothetical protein
VPPALPPSLEEGDRLAGRYVSNVWGYIADLTLVDGAPQIEVVGGSIAAPDEPPSVLSKVSENVYLAQGGFFDGFELTFAFDGGAHATSFAGGLYAFRFDRQGDAPPPTAVDEDADLVGAWQGTAASPLGLIPLALSIADAQHASVTVLSAHDAAVDAFWTERGRVNGQFDLSVPGVGDFRVFLRLHASGGALRGNAYARGVFGESAMPAELERA